IRVWVGAHAPFTLRGEGRELFLECALCVKELIRSIAFHPVFENLDVSWVLVHLSHRNLMGSPEAFGAPIIDLLRTRPTFRRSQHDHRPARTLNAIFPCDGTYALNIGHHTIQRGGHELVHLLWFMSFDKVG